MGIQGAMSLLEEDQRRFGQPWSCNMEDDEDRSVPVVMLVDGMALLYHVTVNQDGPADMSPTLIKEKIANYISKLLQALPNQSQLRIFMDGLAPLTKLPTQIERLRRQAIKGNAAKIAMDEYGDGETTKHTRLLHLLAEWALVEAVEELRKVHNSTRENRKIIDIHRSSRGEAEAYMDFWIDRRVPKHLKVCILADDTDFLVYPNCPGFISFKSLEIKEEEGEVKLSGFEYSRKKFLDAFFPDRPAQDDAMPAIAALAGCDYVLSPQAQQGLEKAASRIVKSDIGGLREKVRNNPTKAQRLTATLRYVSHFMKKEEENWVQALCAAATTSDKGPNGKGGDGKRDTEEDNTRVDPAASILKEALLTIHKTYFRSLTLPNNPAFEVKPSSVEVRRLLEYGIFYCRPIIEAWEPLAAYAATSRKRSLEEVHSAMDSSSFAVVISPPFTRQVAAWMSEDSIWLAPHFYQARLRLYCLLTQYARTGGAYSFEGGQLRLSPMWTSDNPRVTEYVRTSNREEKDGGPPTIQMQERDVLIPTYDCISAGWGDEAELLSGEDAVDRACLFCVLGNTKQAKPAINPCLRGSGTLFLSSTFLPFNLALLLILLGTSPEIEKDKAKEPDKAVKAEVNRVLPFMAVACYHAIFISNALVSLFGTHSEEQKQSNLTYYPKDGRIKGFEISGVLDYEKAVWLWDAIRLGPDLELSQSDDGEDSSEMEIAMDYLVQAMDRLAVQVPQTSQWDAKMKDWKYRAKVLWVIWWDVFNVAVMNTSANTDNNHNKEMNEWDKYILLLSKS